MPNLTLTNMSNALGVYADAPMSLDATQAAITILVDDVQMTFVASKPRWADKLANHYTITVTNLDDANPFEPGDDGKIAFSTDVFNAAVVVHEASIAVTSSHTATDISAAGNKVTLNLTDPIVSGTPAVIEFDIYKAGTEPTP